MSEPAWGRDTEGSRAGSSLPLRWNLTPAGSVVPCFPSAGLGVAWSWLLVLLPGRPPALACRCSWLKGPASGATSVKGASASTSLASVMWGGWWVDP